MTWANKITGPNAGEWPKFEFLTPLGARVGQLCRSAAMHPALRFPFWTALLVILSSSIHAAESARRSESEEWQAAAPEEVGIDSVPLVEMFDFVNKREIAVHSIQLVRRGRLVLDAYLYPYDGRTRHDDGHI